MARLLRSAALCFFTGGVIGAADGLAMAAAARHNFAEPDTSFAQAVLPWGLMAAGLGCIVGAIVGVTCSELFFGGIPTRQEFVSVAVLTLVGGAAFSYLYGGRFMEVSWMATPGVALLASLSVRLIARGGSQ